MIDVGSAVGYLMLDTAGFETGLKRASGDLKVFEDQTATASDKFTAVGSSLTSVGAGLTMGVTLPLLGIGAAALTIGNDFEAQMSRVQAIAGATSTEMKLMEDQALALGASTAFSAGEVAQGMESLASAGFTTNEIMQAMPGLLDLAASSGAELGVASEIAASTLRGFGIDAKDAGHVADVFAEASARTNAGVEDMGEAMKYVAPVASAMGQSLEETAAAVGIMSDAGIKGSQAGTALRGALSKIASPSSAAADAMAELGLNFYDAQGKMLPLNGIISELQTNTKDLTDEQKNNALINIFGQESLSGMLALMQRGPDALNELTDGFVNSDGAAKAMAETMMDNTKGSIEEMFGALETLAILIQQSLSPIIKVVADGVAGFAQKMAEMDEGTRNIVVGVGLFVAALGPLLLAVGGVMTMLPMLSGALVALTGPLGLIIAGVAAFALAWATNFGGIRDATTAIFGTIGTIISTIWGTITGIWDNNLMGIRTNAENAWNLIQTVFETAFTLITDIFNIFSALFSGNWSLMWEGIKTLFSDIWLGIQNILGAALNLVIDVIIGIGVRLWNAGKEAFGKIQEAFSSVWSTLKIWFAQAVNDPVGTIQGIGTAMFEAGKSIITSLWEGLKEIWTSVSSWFTEKIEWIKEKVLFWQNESAKIGGTTRGDGFPVVSSNACGLDYVPRDMNVRVHEGERIMTKQENSSRGSGGGDTFVFQSPKALSEVRAAQEFKRVQQELALGF